MNRYFYLQIDLNYSGIEFVAKRGKREKTSKNRIERDELWTIF